MGSSLQAVVGACDPRSQPAMVLAGGYFGGWTPWDVVRQVCAVDPQQPEAAGAGLGAGVLVVAPAGTCVVAETARIVGLSGSRERRPVRSVRERRGRSRP